MKAIISTILFFVISFSINAQSWCTPGSTWYYRINGMSSTTYEKQTYLYDTIIDGDACHKIQSFYYVQSLSPDFTYVTYYYTKLKDGVLYKNNGTLSAPKFDTLFYFNASIGDKWRCNPDFDESCAETYIEVTDTGRINIQGQSLKWLKIYYENHFMETSSPQVQSGTDTIYERIGTKKVIYTSGMTCFNGTDWPTSYFRCFTDNQIQIQASVSPPCGYLTNTSEMQMDIRENQIQNPVDDFMKGRFDAVDYNIKLYNAVGELVLEEKMRDADFLIKTSQFLSGIYFLRIDCDKGTFLKKVIIQH